MYYYNVQIKCSIPAKGKLIKECVKNADKFKNPGAFVKEFSAQK